MQKKLGKAELMFFITLNVIAVAFILSFLYLLYLRIPLRMNNGPFEDYFAQVLDEYLSGLPIYSKASVGYAPYLYGPLYIYISGLFMNLENINLPMLRIVSIISVAFLPVIYYFILSNLLFKRLTVSYKLSLTVVFTGLYLASFPYTGFWMDIAKVDSLLNFWLLLCFLVYLILLNSNSFRKDVLVLVCLALLSSQFIFIKQSFLAIPFLIGILLFYFKSPRIGLGYFLLTIIIEACFLYREMNIPGSYYYFYSFKLPSLHPLSERGFGNEILTLVLPIALFSLVILWTYFRTRKFNLKEVFSTIREHKHLFSYALFTALVVALGILGRFKHGGFTNSLLYPYCALTSFMVYFTFYDFYEQTNRRFFLFGFIILSQFILLSYDPIKVSEKFLSKVRNENSYLESLCKMEGEIYLEDYSYAPKLYCNKTPFFSNYTGVELMGSQEFFKPLNDSFNLAIQKQRFSRILSSNFYLNDMAEAGYKQSVNNYNRKPTERNLGFKQIMETKLLQFQLYERIPESELTSYEKTFLALHKEYYFELAMYRRKTGK